MEEITTTDSIQREILADARKKAARLLRDADEAAAAAGRAAAAAAEAQAEEIARQMESRVARDRAESEARLPLERARLKTAFVDRRLRSAFEAWMGRLPEERVVALARPLLLRGSPFLSGKPLTARRRGLGAAAAAALVEGAFPGSAAEHLEDPDLPARGLVVEARDGSAKVRATMDLVEEELLSRRRAELARALCAEALDLP